MPFPLIDRLQSNSPVVKQVWYADDATGAAPCSELCAWWGYLLEHGNGFGYHPNASKTYLVVILEEAKHLFAGTNVNITTQGKRHLGAAIGSWDYMEQYVQEKVNRPWPLKPMDLPTKNNPRYPQPFQRCHSSDVHPLAHGRPPCSKLTRSLLALPVRLGGMGLINPSETSNLNYQASEKMTSLLVEIILSQDQTWMPQN